ncbi:MAG: DUF692 domain-containing protein [Alphaproteobacteria bacterium]
MIGISYKPQHFSEILEKQPAIDWLEVHSENYMVDGGPALKQLLKIREHYPISLHGVSLSLGSDEGLNQTHLKRLKALIDLVDPMFVSEHLSWSWHNGVYLNDLLPLPYTPNTLNIMAQHVMETQDYLGRQIFVENPSSYMTFPESTMQEPEFLIELADRSNCKLLFDVNNIYVSAHNNSFDAADYIRQIPPELIGQIHLAGHAQRDGLRIDDHGSCVSDAVWALFEQTIAMHDSKTVPTLIEWDTNVPGLETLIAEAYKAQDIIRHHESPAYAANS